MEQDKKPKLTIWKFPLKVEDYQVIKMPIGALVTSVQMQGETPCIWAIVNPEAETVEVGVRFYGTGHPIYEDIRRMVCVGTIQMEGGALVFHVFLEDVANKFSEEKEGSVEK